MALKAFDVPTAPVNTGISKDFSLQNDLYAHLFDNLTFVDGTSTYGRIVALHISASGIHEVATHEVAWFDRHFSAAFARL